MGNQLAGRTPQQIFPVEHYFTDIPEVCFEQGDCLIVVKVFAIPDPMLVLTQHEEQLERMRSALSNLPNVLPFQQTKLLSDHRAAYLMRQYIKHSLYDRMSTRPFLNAAEKRWIAFQLLCALAQSHRAGVCHGDIKCENVLVTGWNWVLLADYANFKPTYLPEDNPADFSYFFDTSRRRICYIAPERFVKTASDAPGEHFLPESAPLAAGDLTPAMDIFSLGCVFTELFTDGTPPFDFAQLLAYCSGEYQPHLVLDKIEDNALREMIEDMLQKEPSLRHSADYYLEIGRGTVFSEYFYDFLVDYLKTFALEPSMSADQQILKLKQDIDVILTSLDGGNAEGLLAIVNLLTACLRSLKHLPAKLSALELIRLLTPKLCADIVLDRILPYIIYFLGDIHPRVRASAVHTLTLALTQVEYIPKCETNVFPEYILPKLSELVSQDNVVVRMALAENIAMLAESALRFLEMSQRDLSDETKHSHHLLHHRQVSYESELANLHELVQQIVCTLLSDTPNSVKQALLEHGINRLCVFFGRQKANDILLSHMITFLNDKNDRHLRGAFYDNVAGIAAYVGVHCAPILKPLLLQGLSDSEELVISKALRAITDLTEMGLFRKQVLYELLSETTPLLSHPNLWVRHETVGFVCSVARVISLADVESKLKPTLEPYLKHPIIGIDKEAHVLGSLRDPLPRNVYDFLVQLPSLQKLLAVLVSRRGSGLAAAGTAVSRRSMTSSIPVHEDEQGQLASVFRRLESDGFNEAMEEQIVALGEHLLKVKQYKANRGNAEGDSVAPGEIELKLTGVYPRKTDLSQLSFNSDDDDKVTIKLASVGSQQVEMFQRQREIDRITKKRGQLQPLDCHAPYHELRNLTERKWSEWSRGVRMRSAREGLELEPSPSRDKWSPQSILVAHMHEHKGPINRLLALPKRCNLFATCSSDGTVKLWDWESIETKPTPSRSKVTYSRLTGQLTSMAYCNGMDAIAVASDSGNINVFKVEQKGTKILDTRCLDPQEDGWVVDMHHFDTGVQSVLAYVTLFGSVIGWDLRARCNAWRLENSPSNGIITSFCFDPYYNWMVCGTSDGQMICWDMRFQLPIKTIRHNNGARVCRLVPDTRHPSAVWASVKGNSEVSLWQMDTDQRLETLWPSNAPPFEKNASNSHPHSILGLYVASPSGSGASTSDRAPYVITGGTDMRIRYWDLAHPAQSRLVVPSISDQFRDPPTYKLSTIDGSHVIQEFTGAPKQASSEPKRYPENPSVAHHNGITDVNVIRTQTRPYLVSTCYDGVVKVWKWSKRG